MPNKSPLNLQKSSSLKLKNPWAPEHEGMGVTHMYKEKSVCLLYAVFYNTAYVHYENTHIQIYWKFYNQTSKIFS